VSSIARSIPLPPGTTRMSDGEAVSRVLVGRRLKPRSVRTGSCDAATRAIRQSGPRALTSKGPAASSRTMPGTRLMLTCNPLPHSGGLALALVVMLQAQEDWQPCQRASEKCQNAVLSYSCMTACRFWTLQDRRKRSRPLTRKAQHRNTTYASAPYRQEL